MKKELEISRLMNSYTDEEFLTEETQEINAEAVSKRVMAEVKPKKRLRLGAKIMIAAAAVIGVSVITAASLPVATFTSLTGRIEEYSIIPGQDCTIPGLFSENKGNEILPYSVEGDRIYFTADGSHTDITDLIGEEDIYYYEYIKEDDQGNEHLCCIGVAGTVRYPVYGEIIMGIGLHSGQQTIFCSGVYEKNYLIGDRVVNINDMTEEEFLNIEKYECSWEMIELPWVEKFEYRAAEYQSRATGEDIEAVWERMRRPEREEHWFLE